MLLTLRKIVILYMQTDKFMFSYLILLFAICFFFNPVEVNFYDFGAISCVKLLKLKFSPHKNI